MNITQAKFMLDTVIKKSRVHFYKPFQIAEILRHARLEGPIDLSDVETYRNTSRRWRDDVSRLLVGRCCNSSARYQDDLFNATACPPEALVVLGECNIRLHGVVEAYIYSRFGAKVSAVGDMLSQIEKATPGTFDLQKFMESFEASPGLKRSMDKIFEISVYALVSTVVRALRVEVSVSVLNSDPLLMRAFEDFLGKVVGLPKGARSVKLPASVFRLGATNAADRGLDMVANFGLAIQVKHLTLDADAIADICESVTAPRIVIVCKDSEIEVIGALVQQLGLTDRLQAVVTLSDLCQWYEVCMRPHNSATLGVQLLADFAREFMEEFPSMGGLNEFMRHRVYTAASLPNEWAL